MTNHPDTITVNVAGNAPRPGDTHRPAALRDFVRYATALGIDTYTLDVRTGNELHAALVAIGGHNNYDPDAVAAALSPMIGRMSRVRIESFIGGPAVHLELPHWTHQRIDAGPFTRMGTKYAAEERVAAAHDVRAIGRRLHADEITVRQSPRGGFEVEHVATGAGADPIEVRLWWD